MIYESIQHFFGQQNFALVTTNLSEASIFRNVVGNQSIFCVLIDNTKSHLWTVSQLSVIKSQLISLSQKTFRNDCDVLFIVITSDTGRDVSLASAAGNVWLADTAAGHIIIPDGQNPDFYGLRAGIEAAASDGRYEGTPYTSAPEGVRAGYKPGKAGQTGSSKIPTITIILIALNLIYYVILSLLGNTEDSHFMYVMGANFADCVFNDLEIWRLVTAMFMHFGISHLISNMIYLGVVGYSLENIIGHWKFLLIYMLSGIGGNLISAAYYYVTGSVTLSAGASGAVYGLVGATCYLTLLNFRRMRPAFLFLRIGIMLVFVFYSSFVNTGVDGAAHIGGFIFGFLLALLTLRSKRRDKQRR